MRARGLTGSRDTLSPALTADETDNVDSDGDGITDVDELKNGTDVNSPANDCIIPSGTPIDDGQCTPGSQVSPTLGCTAGASTATTGPRSMSVWVLIFLLALILRRVTSA
jgi:hypothetical protein